MKGDSGDNLIGLLERRLDAVVYRAKFVPTFLPRANSSITAMSRSMAAGKYCVLSGETRDMVEIKESSRQLILVLEAEQLAERDVPDYYEVDQTKKTAKLSRIPCRRKFPIR